MRGCREPPPGQAEGGDNWRTERARAETHKGITAHGDSLRKHGTWEKHMQETARGERAQVGSARWQLPQRHCKGAKTDGLERFCAAGLEPIHQ